MSELSKNQQPPNPPEKRFFKNNNLIIKNTNTLLHNLKRVNKFLIKKI
jgi:hypothetical protein